MKKSKLKNIKIFFYIDIVYSSFLFLFFIIIHFVYYIVVQYFS